MQRNSLQTYCLEFSVYSVLFDNYSFYPHWFRTQGIDVKIVKRGKSKAPNYEFSVISAGLDPIPTHINAALNFVNGSIRKIAAGEFDEWDELVNMMDEVEKFDEYKKREPYWIKLKREIKRHRNGVLVPLDMLKKHIFETITDPQTKRTIKKLAADGDGAVVEIKDRIKVVNSYHRLANFVLTGETANVAQSVATLNNLMNSPNLNQNMSYKEKQNTKRFDKDLVVKLLQKYVDRIESHQSNGGIDYQYGFFFMKKSRAANRKANYLLAKELITELKTPEPDLSVFGDYLITKFRNEKLATRRINSKELNNIIDSVNADPDAISKYMQ